MIEVVHEHSVDLSLLRERANILDLGCRGFGFTHAMRDLGHTVFPVDIDDLPEFNDYERCAITNYTGYCGIIHTNDPQGTKIGPGNSIPCYTLEDYMKLKRVEFWDLLKSDIEGAEYEMVLNLTKPPAKQVSMEMHMHCGQKESQVWDIVLKLKELGYQKAAWDYSEKHGAGLNVWDALFILK